MTDTTKTPSTPRQIAQRAVDAAQKRVDKAAQQIAKAEQTLAEAKAEKAAAEQIRDYRKTHPALQQQPTSVITTPAKITDADVKRVTS